MFCLVDKIDLRIELAMEYKINKFNGIPFWVFGCVWYSPVRLRFEWNTKSCLDVQSVELKVFFDFEQYNCSDLTLKSESPCAIVLVPDRTASTHSLR